MPKQCLAVGCFKQPTFGEANSKLALYCGTHKRADDINVIKKKCQAPGCSKIPVFGKANTKCALFCAAHKRTEDVDVRNKRCLASGCSKQPVYGEANTKLTLYCVIHKRAGDVDVRNKRCQAPGCPKLSAFGEVNTKLALYCAAHKRVGDVNVVSKRCQALGCPTLPTYGVADTKVALYCVIHKRADDVNVKRKRCITLGCLKIPTYGEANTKTALYCAAHRRADDVNVASKKCQMSGCTKSPVFGEADTKIALYCIAHKRTEDVDVRNKRCQASGCSKQSRYGKPGNRAERCKEHATKGLIVYPTKRCDDEKCNELGIWGANASAKARRCDRHKKPDDKNLIEGHCASCGLEAVLDKTNVCQSCGEFSRVKRLFLVKQTRAKAAIEKHFEIESYDKILDGGVCTKKRPDVVLKGRRRIVVEIDEFQHKRGYDYSQDCEVRRMWDIAQALGEPTVFVRYNPDSYINIEKKRCNPPAEAREAALISWIRTLQNREPKSFATALYLYYDGFSKPEAAVEELLADPLETFGGAALPASPALLVSSLADNEFVATMAELGLD